MKFGAISLVAASCAALLAAPLQAAPAPEKDFTVAPTVTKLPNTPKRYLLVGNSFMYYNCGVNSYINGIGKSKGISFTGTMVTISGAGLDWHLVDTYLRPNGLRSYSVKNDGSNQLVFNKYPNGLVFEAVIMMDNSQGPINPALAPRFEEYAPKHIEAVKKTGASPMLLATWAYVGKPEMTRQLSDATTKVGNAAGAMVIPAGLAFAKSLALRPDLKLNVKDNRHPTAAGTYLEACVIFAAMTGQSPEGSDYKGGCEKPLKAEDAAHLQKVAWETVKAFYGWK